MKLVYHFCQNMTHKPACDYSMIRKAVSSAVPMIARLERWMALVASLAMVLQSVPAKAATIYTEDGSSYYISAWATGGLPVQPNVEWRFADGLDYDTLVTIFRNYGSSALPTGLTIVNPSALAEGFLDNDQTGLNFDGINNYLNDASATELAPAGNDFGVFMWVRWTDVTSNVFASKWSETDNQREWTLLSHSAFPGQVRVLLSNPGAGTYKDYVTDLAYNDGKWHLIGFTWISDVLVVYVDGALPAVTQLSNGALLTLTTGTARMAVGCYLDAGTPSNLYAGEAAWFGYWEGAGTPTAAQVAQLNTSMRPTGTAAFPYPCLQAAAYEGAAGDTILVNAGTYQETVTIATAFDYVGATTTTFGNWPVLYGASLLAASGTTGLTVTAPIDSFGGVGFLDVRGYYSGIGVLGSATSDGSIFHHLVVDSCLNGVDFDGACSGDTLVNVTIDGASLGSSTGFRTTTSSAVTVVLHNTIIVNTVTGITKTAGHTLTGNYNNLFGNTTAYSGTTAGANDLAVAPRFRAPNDYRPRNVALKAGLAIHSQVAPFDRIFIGAWWPEALLNQGGRVWGGRGEMKWGRFGDWGGR